MMKNFKSRFFEDYFVGDEINHSVPRTVSEGDVTILATPGVDLLLITQRIFKGHWLAKKRS